MLFYQQVDCQKPDVDLEDLVFPNSILNFSTIDTFAGIDQIQNLPRADTGSDQSNLNSRTNLQMDNIATTNLYNSEGNKLPNCVPRSSNSVDETDVSNYVNETNHDENKMQNNELSSAICLQLKNYASIETDQPIKVSKTNSGVNSKAGGTSTQNSLPITSRVETISENSSINENVTRMETSTDIEKSDCEGTILEDIKTEELIQLNKERDLAIRSLGTNLLLFSLVILTSVLYLVPSPTWQSFFTAANESLQKGLLPTLSTMANFGTIRSVALQYWKYSSNRIHPS